MRHLLSIESLTPEDMLRIVTLGGEMKATRGRLAKHVYPDAREL